MSLSSLPAPFARRAPRLDRARRISKVPLNHFATRYLDSTLNRTRPRNAMPYSGSCLLMRARTTLLHFGTCSRASATRIVPASMTALLRWLRLPQASPATAYSASIDKCWTTGGVPSAMARSGSGALTRATGLSRRAIQSSWLPASYGSCVAELLPALCATKHASRSRELQPCLAQRMFLRSEGSYDANSESAIIPISIGNHLLSPVRVIRGQYFAGSARRGWRDRSLPRGFHREGRIRQAHLYRFDQSESPVRII